MSPTTSLAVSACVCGDNEKKSQPSFSTRLGTEKTKNGRLAGTDQTPWTSPGDCAVPGQADGARKRIRMIVVKERRSGGQIRRQPQSNLLQSRSRLPR